ncbi:gamma-glutamyl-gamma-aminobutyrate hydrolase family protein [Varunaivibrio sulfuroxidans]|uniref:Putative glutamine amidotransferase n=1 Tax=Varunaivibrio sulfuroxidans TaxID=1773489 RepID=A0A4R3J5M5_9PROT|nr:gamma-glutamyl-gamma-aminobutyrate hydrolase family protein [Varunaivibrio sulfuroxidans]TCS60627.1 putative glutamine amidotransferase [Varunaivibrio sulfuroxidans]WES30116.1 gamma-glutamyl-gamma-aminobutyrate hydrolase family protein [Varunaivibrio sulfuroxidans]
MKTSLIPPGPPLIAITLDSENAGGYSKFPWYALRQNYAGAIAAAGGVPVALPHRSALADAYLERIDALLVTGGDFDIDPAMYGADHRHHKVTTKDARTGFELAMLRGALARDMPVLAICGGQQLLHVALGGALVQHIPDEIPGALAHEQPNPRDQVGHNVDIVPGTRLAQIIGAGTIGVNSAHHQAALFNDKSGEPKALRVNARAPDGVIEGVEAVGQTFCIGVQWHPEFEITPADSRLIAAFVDAAGNYADTKARPPHLEKP